MFVGGFVDCLCFVVALFRVLVSRCCLLTCCLCWVLRCCVYLLLLGLVRLLNLL